MSTTQKISNCHSRSNCSKGANIKKKSRGMIVSAHQSNKESKRVSIKNSDKQKENVMPYNTTFMNDPSIKNKSSTVFSGEDKSNEIDLGIYQNMTLEDLYNELCSSAIVKVIDNPELREEANISLEEFKNIVKNGPPSLDYIYTEGVSGKVVGYSLFDEFGRKARISIRLHERPQKIYGYYYGKRVVNKIISEDYADEWLKLAKMTERKFPNILINT